MYYAYFGIERPPFNLTPDPSFLYLAPKHCEALAGIAYGLLARKGFVVLTGAAGTGKTTVLTHVIGQLPVSRVRSSIILNPTLSAAEFLEAVMLDFDIDEIPPSKSQRIATLQKFLWATHRAGQVAVLIVDEAHKLSLELLEEIRLLGNFESATEKLLQIALIGQRELDELLNSRYLEPLNQRIARRMTLDPLETADIGPYIQHRWCLAGGKKAPFSADAIDCIAQVTHGTPRLINVVCDNALIEAFADEAAVVERRHVIDVCRDLQWPSPAAQMRVPSVEPAPVPAANQELPAPSGDDSYPVKMLERYSTGAVKASFMARLRKKFTSPRTETA